LNIFIISRVLLIIYIINIEYVRYIYIYIYIERERERERERLRVTHSFDIH